MKHTGWLSAIIIIMLCGFEVPPDTQKGLYTISGTLLSSKDGRPIMGGISIKKLKTGTYTDTLGNFKLMNIRDGHHRCRFFALGYQSKDSMISLSGTNMEHLTITLQEKEKRK